MGRQRVVHPLKFDRRTETTVLENCPKNYCFIRYDGLYKIQNFKVNFINVIQR